MWVDGKSDGSGDISTVVINELPLISTTPRTFECTKAYFTIGTEASYSQYCIGYVEDGELTVLYNYSKRHIISYTNGVLSIAANQALTTANGYLKIMYSTDKGQSGGLAEAFHKHTSTLGSSWNTGAKLDDAKVIIAYSDTTARMFHAINDNGNLLVVREISNNDSSLTVDNDGYLVFSCTNATVKNSPATIYGYK